MFAFVKSEGFFAAKVCSSTAMDEFSAKKVITHLLQSILIFFKSHFVPKFPKYSRYLTRTAP